MAMKGKPNTDQFTVGKDPSAFLESGAADIAEAKSPAPLKQDVPESTTKPEAVRVERQLSNMLKEQKVFRLSLDVIKALKKESYERSVKTESRITETEIVELALRKYLKV